MAIEYHGTAWCCPKCGWWTGVSRYKHGNHVRKCRNTNCKFNVRVDVEQIEKTRTYLGNIIVGCPTIVKAKE